MELFQKKKKKKHMLWKVFEENINIKLHVAAESDLGADRFIVVAIF